MKLSKQLEVIDSALMMNAEIMEEDLKGNLCKESKDWTKKHLKDTKNVRRMLQHSFLLGK